MYVDLRITHGLQVRANRYLFDQPSIYNFEYDSLNRLTAANSYLPDFGTSNNLGNTIYNYDKIGNITNLELIVDNQNTTQAYDYVYEGSTNRLSFVEGKQGAINRNYTYDSNGNLKSDNSRKIVDVDYNIDNMPISIRKSENIEGFDKNEWVDYKYGINNERVYKQVYDQYNLPIVQGSVAEYYLTDPNGNTIGMLDLSSGEWEWYAHGLERIARIKPIPSNQPTFYPRDWWSGKDDYNGVSALDVNEIRLAIENYMLEPGEPNNLLFNNNESLNLQMVLESELSEEGEVMFNPEMSMSLESPNQLLVFNGSNGETYTTTLAAFYEGSTAASLPDVSATWMNRASLAGGVDSDWTSSGTLIASPKQVDYYRYDHLGNTRVVYEAEWDIDLNQIKFNLKGAYDYFPYGKILRSYVPGNGYERYLTTQHERDAETISENNAGTGLDNRGARFYDSDVARFLSLDPAAAEYPSWSDYNYVLGNPVMFIDPDGKRADWFINTLDGSALFIKGQNKLTTNDVQNPSSWRRFGGDERFGDYSTSEVIFMSPVSAENFMGRNGLIKASRDYVQKTTHTSKSAFGNGERISGEFSTESILDSKIDYTEPENIGKVTPISKEEIGNFTSKITTEEYVEVRDFNTGEGQGNIDKNISIATKAATIIFDIIQSIK